MIDINATDFIERFETNIPKGTVGVVGHGYVGHAVEVFFHKKFAVKVYDKAKPEFHTMEDVVKESQLIFVCVPTPMRKDGSCYTGIIENVLENLVQTAKDVGRNLGSLVVIIKSTVYPGFTNKMKSRFPGVRLLFCPEFLTEKNSLEDFEKTNRVVLGGDMDDARVAFKYFEACMKERILSGQTGIVQMDDPTSAEMVKLFTNGMLMTKVLFSNEMYQLCQKLNVNYEEVRVVACLDRRIGDSHTVVPGHDGSLGAGGHCFPKDINNLRHVCRELGVQEKIFTAVIERNNELREDKDWERMKDRAVIDE